MASPRVRMREVSKLANLTTAYIRAHEQAEAAKIARDAQVLVAQEAGATYDALARAVQVTPYRILQILRRERARATAT